MRKHLVTYLTSSYILGILFSTHFHYLLFYSILFSFVFLLISWKFLKKYFSFFTTIFFFNLGIFATNLQNKIPINHYSNLINNENLVEFKFIEQQNSSEFYKKYVAEVKKISSNNNWKICEGKLLIKLKKENKFDVDYTKKYIAKLQITDIEEPKNPHQFNYKNFLKTKEIYFQAKIKKIIKSSDDKFDFFASLMNFRSFISKKIQNSSFSENSKNILDALTIGNQTEMKQELVEDFAKAGVIHFLSISGLHVGILFLTLLYIFKFLNQNRFSNTTIVSVVLILIWLYGIFVGLVPSVFRACIMISVYELANIFKRPQPTTHVLSIAALIILLISPNQLFSIGFQLSFCSVFFIGLFYSKFTLYFKKLKLIFPELFYSVFCITLAAQIGTLPLTLFYFHQTSLLSVLANLIIVPFSTIILIYSFINVFIVCCIPKLEFLVVKVYDYIIEIMRLISHFVATQDFFIIENMSLSLIQMIILFIIIYLLNFLFNKKKQKIVYLYILLCISIFSLVKFMEHTATKTKNEFIVFHQPFGSLMMFRKGFSSSLYHKLKDSTQLKTSEKYVLKSFYINEHIVDIQQFKRSHLLYSYENEKIYVPKKNEDKSIPKNITFILLSNSPKIDFEKLKNPKIKYVIADGNNSKYYLKVLKEYFSKSKIQHKLWITEEKGAFIYKFNTDK